MPSYKPYMDIVPFFLHKLEPLSKNRQFIKELLSLNLEIQTIDSTVKERDNDHESLSISDFLNGLLPTSYIKLVIGQERDMFDDYWIVLSSWYYSYSKDKLKKKQSRALYFECPMKPEHVFLNKVDDVFCSVYGKTLEEKYHDVYSKN